MLPAFTESDRPLQVMTPLGPGAVLLAEVRGTEAVNELFAFDLHLLAPLDRPPVRFEALLGKPIAVRVRRPGGDHRVVHGLITALTRRGRDRLFTHYRAEVRPAWWPATLRVNSRIFQQQTAPDILRAVLGGFGPVEFRLTGQYPHRNYTVQYRETDWAFASRVMEEEGLFHFFTHREDGHTLVIADGVPACPPVLRSLAFDDAPDAARDRTRPVAWRWDKTQELCPTGVTVWDSHFQLFRKTLAAEAAPPAVVMAGTADHAPVIQGGPDIPVYRHDGDYAKRFDGVAPGGGDRTGDLAGVYPDADRTARLRAEQASARSVRIDGESNAPELTPGHVARLDGHPDADDRYVVTRVSHSAAIPEAFWASDAGGDFTYRNEFEAAPTALPPRPPLRTPRPVIGGMLTAVVTGPPGQEIFVDPYGRVKVQFLWDRTGRFDADSSCWVRCAQLWAGKGWGAFFWPRVGMEVVVQFVDGDPDRPLVTGCVYNVENLPPTRLPAEATVGGIKSCIFRGDPAVNFNAVYFQDTPGVEYVQVHSERSEVQQSEANRFHYTGGLKFSVHGRL